MTLAALPDVTAVPGPFWLLTGLHLLTFLLHVVAMASLVGGVVVLLAAPRSDLAASPGARRLVALLPVLMAATVSLGVAPLLFLQLSYGKVVYGASVTCGVFWFFVPFTAMAAYACLYVAARREREGRRPNAWLGTALLALVAVSVIYAATFALAERPTEYARLYGGTASGLALNPDVATWGPRWLQILAAAIALGAFVARLVVRGDAALERTALRVLAIGTLVSAAAAGLRFVLDADLRPALGSTSLGGIGTVLFALGAVLPLAAAPLVRRGSVAVAGGILVAGAALTVIARHVARLGVLSGRFDPTAPPIRTQWDVFALFVLCLLVALGLIAWMLRAWFGAAARPARAA